MNAHETSHMHINLYIYISVWLDFKFFHVKVMWDCWYKYWRESGIWIGFEAFEGRGKTKQWRILPLIRASTSKVRERMMIIHIIEVEMEMGVILIIQITPTTTTTTIARARRGLWTPPGLRVTGKNIIHFVLIHALCVCVCVCFEHVVIWRWAQDWDLTIKPMHQFCCGWP